MPEHAAKRAAALPSLKAAEWLKRPETLRVFAALSGPDVETRAVGGAVRNGLLGQAVAEVDLATTALPEQVMALTRKAGLKAVPTGIEHGTVTVIADGKPFEVTTLRRDVETFGRHATVAFTEDWEEDARRRDFTLNALYAASDGTVFDPLGGYDDLLAGRVRFIGNAEARIKEDYLRILRFFRFNAYYGKDALGGPKGDGNSIARRQRGFKPVRSCRPRTPFDSPQKQRLRYLRRASRTSRRARREPAAGTASACCAGRRAIRPATEILYDDHPRG